jgi:hypothetical protein
MSMCREGDCASCDQERRLFAPTVRDYEAMVRGQHQQRLGGAGGVGAGPQRIHDAATGFASIDGWVSNAKPWQMPDLGKIGAAEFKARCERCGMGRAVCQCAREQVPTPTVDGKWMGWCCPRCKVVHAPHVSRCECKA